MSLPGSLRRTLAGRLIRGAVPRDALQAEAREIPAADSEDGLGLFRPVGGGCIHQAGILDTAAGPVFLKWNRGEAGTGFTSEARSLEALRAGSAPELLDVPEVLDARDADPVVARDAEPLDERPGDIAGAAGGASGRPADDGDAGDFGWLVLEFLPPSPPAPDHDVRLGRGLAHLHGRSAESFGWPETNRIGPLPQANPTRESWADFWVDARLLPQLRGARDAGMMGSADVDLVERVAKATPLALEPVAGDPPGLVHGDLWSGNVHPGPRGRPVLVDPASYHGHGEVDLAMARLFGGFGSAFFEAYEERRPLPEGFETVRCPLYQLFYLLVHVRLFGGSYLGRTRSAARSVLAAVG